MYIQCIQTEYIPRIIHTVHALLRFAGVWNGPIIPVSFRVILLALGQAYDCPSAIEETLDNMGQCILSNKNWFKNHSENKINETLYIFHGICYIICEDFNARRRYQGHEWVIVYPTMFWGVITFPYRRYLLLAPKSSYIGARDEGRKTNKECCIRSSYHGQGQVFTSHSICGM